jgi:hypothetical protein
LDSIDRPEQLIHQNVASRAAWATTITACYSPFNFSRSSFSKA